MERTFTLYCVIVSLAVCLLVAMPAAAAGAVAVDLEPPQFSGIGSAESGDCAVPAFNTSRAGISSYVNAGQAIPLKNGAAAFNQSLVSDNTNYAIGEIWILNYGTLFKPNVYFDTAGNIVAYYPAGTAGSSLISWTGVTLSSPVIADFTTNLAIKRLCDKAGISYDAIKGNIRYYNYGYPAAEKMLVFVNGAPMNTVESAQIQVPASFTQYEASGSVVQANIYADGVLMKSTADTAVFSYGTALANGAMHTLRLNALGYSQGGAAGTVIIYSEG